MNEGLIKLYFELEKEQLHDNENQQIKDVDMMIIRKSIDMSNPFQKEMLSEFKNNKLSSLIKEPKKEKSIDEKECDKIILKVIEETLGEDLIQAKKIREEITLRRFLEQKAK